MKNNSRYSTEIINIRLVYQLRVSIDKVNGAKHVPFIHETDTCWFGSLDAGLAWFFAKDCSRWGNCRNHFQIEAKNSIPIQSMIQHPTISAHRIEWHKHANWVS